MKTLNTIAFEHLLKSDAHNSNTKSEEITREVTRINLEQDIKIQKSLLFQMYALEEEGEDFFA